MSPNSPLNGTVAPAPRLHPNLAEVYRQKVATLTDLLRREDAAEVRDMVRGLVETIVLVPEGERLGIEIHGELATILGLAEGARKAPPMPVLWQSKSRRLRGEDLNL